MTMSLLRFNELLDAYGADPERWPLEDRVGATELLARSNEARALARNAAEVDDLLEAVPLNLPQGPAGRTRARRPNPPVRLPRPRRPP